MFEGIKSMLGTILIRTEWIYIDLWSILHFIWGYLLYSMFHTTIYTALIVIGVYEFIEPKFTMFNPENKIDTIWDIIITFCGYIIAMKGIL